MPRGVPCPVAQKVAPPRRVCPSTTALAARRRLPAAGPLSDVPGRPAPLQVFQVGHKNVDEAFGYELQGHSGRQATEAKLKQRYLDSRTFSSQPHGAPQRNGLLGLRPLCLPGKRATTDAGRLAFPQTLTTSKFFVRAPSLPLFSRLLWNSCWPGRSQSGTS